MRQSCDNFVAVGGLLRPLMSAKRRGDWMSVVKENSGLAWQVIDLVRVRKNGVLRLIILWSKVRVLPGPPLNQGLRSNPTSHSPEYAVILP